ncbi:MAG: alpha-ketoglutarate-dependent dioxygenase AlkB [Myxococcota bacterium]
MRGSTRRDPTGDPAGLLLGGALEVIAPLLLRPEADRLLAVLLETVDWDRKEIQIFGRRLRSPRWTAWYGDPGACYRYSGLSLEPLPWLDPLLELRERVQEASGGVFNGVLLNLYRDGSNSMGWHSDDEADLGHDPLIGSLTLGAERRFLLRRRARDAGMPPETLELTPGHGTLLLMRGSLQREWKHSVPKTRRAVGPRINLSFRKIVTLGRPRVRSFPEPHGAAPERAQRA